MGEGIRYECGREKIKSYAGKKEREGIVEKKNNINEEVTKKRKEVNVVTVMER